jgi:hypothetical protein
MAEASGIRAGKAFVELSLQDKFSKGIDAASKKLKDWGQNISNVGKWAAAAGAAITGPLLAAAKLSADSGAALYDMSRRTGLAAEFLSTLGYAADRTGADLNTVEGAVKRMQKSLAGMADEMEGTTGKLDMLGLSAADLVGQSPEQQFLKIAKAIAAIHDPTTKAAAAMSVFGRSGTSIIPLLEDFDSLQARAKELGFVRSTDSVIQAKALSDAMYDATRATKSLIGAMVSGIIPVLREKTQTIMRVTLAVRDFVKEHKDLVVIVFKAATAVGLIGSALFLVGTYISALGPFLGVAKILFSALASPLGLVTLGLIAATAAAIYFSGNGATVLAWLGKQFNALKGIATTALGGIGDALAAGDISLAAQILWTALKLAWIQGTRDLRETWAAWKADVVSTAVRAFYGVLDIWTNVYASLQTLWANASSTFVALWASAVHETTKIFDKYYDWQRQKEKERLQREIDNPNTSAKRRQILKAAVDNLDGDAGRIKAARDKQDASDAEQRQKDLQARIAEIEAQRQRTIQEHSEREQAIGAAADANARKEIENLEKERRDLEAKLKDLRGKAQKERASKSDPLPTLANGNSLANLDDALKGAQNNNLKSQGIFNVAALQSLQASPTQDAIKKAAQETAKNTKKIADQRTAFA